MATVTAFIRVKQGSKKAYVRFRLRDGHTIQLFHKSDIEVNLSKWKWDPKKQGIHVSSKNELAYVEKSKFNLKISERKDKVLEVYHSLKGKGNITSLMLDEEISKIINPETFNLINKPQTFFESFTEFLEVKKLAESRKRAFMVIYRVLQRYEMYKRITGHKEFKLTLDDISATTLRNFEKFLIDEHKLYEKYPKIYEAIPEIHKTRKAPKPEPRGQNTLNGIFVKIRTFFLWAIDNGKTTNNPFKAFKIEESVYGTPFYITIEERNKLYNTDLSNNPQMEVQRDIFVFQCLIGCRVGDLLKFKKENIINGAVEYIARKTKNGHPVTVRVPLNSISKAILEKYKYYEGPGLFPFITEQRYNDYIKDMFKKAELTRIVTVLNPTTREAEQHPINEVASSHLARRCFVGNLYKQVRDPNLVGALSGHKEGSKAFHRYREIDDEMKNELVKMLE